MKPAQIVGSLFLFAVLALGCTTSPSPDPRPEAIAMKGYELYSWQHDGKWQFSLLVGTNREKPAHEVQASEVAIADAEELAAALHALAPGQEIFWRASEALPLPPADIIAAIQRVCDDNQHRLRIVQ